MKEVVYIIGAGINQVIKDWAGLSPPMSNNLFKIAFEKNIFRWSHNDGTEEMFDFIQTNFKQDKTNLTTRPFDLESCFTLLEYDINEAENVDNRDELSLGKLYRIRNRLIVTLATVLSGFDNFAYGSLTMRNLGNVILLEKPTMITFNYDCILENTLKTASGVQQYLPKEFQDSLKINEEELPDAMLTWSHYNWNKPLGYGFKFDEIQLQQSGVPRFAEGTRFYLLPGNQLYDKPLLKLHGSINWFKYVQKRAYPPRSGETEPSFGESKSKIILQDEHWIINNPPHHKGWIISPLIITPVMYKDEYYRTEPFKELWERARISISKCSKLVIIGYSFPPTDFSTKRLLIRALVEHELEELIVINPDHNVVKVAKEVCNFNGGIVWYASLDDYVRTFRGLIPLELD